MARKFKLIFLLSLTLLTILGTTSYAKTNLSDEEVSYIVDNAFTYNTTDNLYNNLWFENNDNYVSAQMNTDNLKTVFKEAFNQNNTLNFNNDLQNFFGYWASYKISGITYSTFYYTNEVNYGKFDGYNHVFINFKSESYEKYYLGIVFIDDNKNAVSVPLKAIDFKTPDYQNFELITYRETTSSTSTTTAPFIFRSSPTWNEQNLDNGLLENISGIINFSSTNSIYTNYNGSNFHTVVPKLLISNYVPTTPEEPDNPEESGDVGEDTTTPDYSQDLDNIQNGINDINNNISETNNKLDNISGELSNINNNLTTVPDLSETTITNDDITSNLDFEFEQDPYTNFWLELTTGLGNSFSNSVREISIQFRNKTHIISLDNFSVQIPSALKPFLTIISTVFITWKMLKYIKIIIDNISSGNIDEVLEMNEEEGITNLF